MEEYEIFFYPSLSTKGLHVYRCKSHNMADAYTLWAADNPFGIAYHLRNREKAEIEGAIYHYQKPEETKVERKPNFRERMEATKVNRK